MKRKNLLLPLLMTLLMMAISPQSVWALGGSGTSSSPYTIASAADLVAFASKVNGGETGAYAKLTADITLTSAWAAMGTSSKPYTGTFDGQGHKISGLSLTATAANAGLFGYVNGATIKNFSLAGSISSNSDNVGSVVGSADGATKIYNVYSSVNIKMTAAKSHIGGIAGQLLQENSKVSEIKGCAYSGTMNLGSCSDSNGGIVGFCEKNANIEIEYCLFSGSMSTSVNSPNALGGILGYADDDGDSQNFQSLKYCFVSGTLSPNSGTNVGAIAGQPKGKVANTGIIANNNYVSGVATNALGNSKTSATSTPINISVTAGTGGTVSYTYVNPTSTTATQLQVTATPNPHYHFFKWGDGGEQTHTIALTSSYISNLIAAFELDNHTIIFDSNDQDMGYIAGEKNGCSLEYEYGSQINVIAREMAFYHFVQWSDGEKNASRTITVTEDKTYTAIFAPDLIDVTVKVEDNQSTYGSVDGGGVFEYNSKQTITATPNTGYHFVEWNDHDTHATREITVRSRNLNTYTATFAPNPYTITVKTNDSSMGTVSGGGTFDYKSTKTITATPKAHYHFVQWNDGVKTASRQISVTGNATYTATFEIDQHTITLKTNDSNMGTVSGGGTFNYNSTKTITATPKEHYHFVEWNDGNTDATRTITVTGAATYTATFAPNPYTITVNVASGQSSMGTVSGGGTYNYGTQQTITATPEEHYHFVQWNDGNTDASRTITVTDDAQQNTYTATFAIDQHTIALNVNNSNMGTVTGSGTFDYNSQQVITATPNTGCDFIGWSDGIKDSTRQITVTDDAQQNTYTANFIQARAILTDGTLTFYYDGIDHDGTAYPLNTGADRPGWHEKNSDITTVVFDASFASMRPTSCAFWFDDCKNLSSITGIEYLNTERVTTMELMFYGCRVLSSLDVTGFNTEQVTDMDHMFYGCKKLTSLNLSSFNTANVENMSYMFSNCRELSELTIGNFDMQRVFYAYRMFYDPETFLSLSALNTLTLKSLPFLADGTFNTQFSGDGKTVNVILDDNSVIYEGTNYLPTITNCNHYKQWGDDHICTVCHQPAAIAHTGTSGTCTWTIYEDGHMIIEPTEGESGTLAYWGEESFAPWLAHYSEIKSVEFRGEVIASTCFRLFMSCNYLRNIDFKGFNTANVTNMKQMFAACKSLQTLDLSSFNTANVTAMQGMFQDCSSLQSLDLSSFNTANVNSMVDMFYGCTSLQSLDLSSFNTANVQDMADMFFSCFVLQSLDLSSFNTANVEVMKGMFSYCLSLATLKLSNDFVLKEGVNKEDLFQGCGRDSDRLSIFYVIDQSIIEALESDTQLGTHEFVRSAIVKDGVPFMTAIWAWDIPAGNIVFTRTFTPNKPATITLPFEVHVDVVTNAKFYGFTSLDYNNATGKWEANMDRVKDDFIHAYTPYMILTEAESIDFDNVNAYFMPTPSELYNTTQGDWTFVATNEDKVWTAGDFGNGQAYYGFAAGDETTPEGMFVRVGQGASISPLRAYLMKTPQDGGANNVRARAASTKLPSIITVRLNEEEATGIGTLNTETGEFNIEGWYDMQGRRINKPAKNGISIINGKKVLVK